MSQSLISLLILVTLYLVQRI